MGKSDESGADETEETDDQSQEDDESTETKRTQPDPRIKKLSNEAAKYRKQRNGARVERDEAKVELAFVKAVGRRFADVDAAFKLLDKSAIEVAKDGEISGLDEAIDALAESNPFLLTGDDETEDEDPFKATRSRTSSRKFNGPRRPTTTGLDRAALQRKFPSLRRLG